MISKSVTSDSRMHQTDTCNKSNCLQGVFLYEDKSTAPLKSN